MMAEHEVTDKMDGEFAQTMMMQNRQQTESFIRYQLDSSEILIEMEHYLRSEEFNEEQGVWVKISWKGGDGVETLPPIANEVGVKRIINELKPRVNKISNMTNLDDDQICEMLWELNAEIINLLENKSVEFEIEAAYCPNIVNMIDHLVECQLYRALDEGERKRLYPSQQTVEHIHRGNEGDKKGGFSLFGKSII